MVTGLGWVARRVAADRIFFHDFFSAPWALLYCITLCLNTYSFSIFSPSSRAFQLSQMTDKFFCV